MDTKTFLLGIIPPALAFLAEARNPVSAEAIRPQASRAAVQHVPAADATTTGGVQPNPQPAIDALATTITAIAETAAEVAGIIPTWISVTAAITAVLVDLVNVEILLVLLFVFTAVSSLLAIPFFQQENFRDQALIAGRRTRFCGTGRQVDCISWYIKAVNIALAALVLGVWIFTSEPKADLAGQRQQEILRAIADLNMKLDRHEQELPKLRQDVMQSLQTFQHASGDLVPIEVSLATISKDIAEIRARLPGLAQPIGAPARPSATRQENDLSKADWKTVQAALLDREKIDPGPINGVKGNRTRQAIARYQAKIHANPDGILTPGQIESLLGSAN